MTKTRIKILNPPEGGSNTTSLSHAERYVARKLARWVYSSRRNVTDTIEFIQDDHRFDCAPRPSPGFVDLGRNVPWVDPVVIRDSGISLTPHWPDATELKKRQQAYERSLQPAGPVEHKTASYLV